MTWIKHNWAFLLAIAISVLPPLLVHHLGDTPGGQAHWLGLLAAILPLVIKQLGSKDITAAYHKGLSLGRSIEKAEEEAVKPK